MQKVSHVILTKYWFVINVIKDTKRHMSVSHFHMLFLAICRSPKTCSQTLPLSNLFQDIPLSRLFYHS